MAHGTLRSVMMLQMTSGNKSAAVDVLPGIGSGAHVPRFLRTNAKIKNKGFSKAQASRHAPPLGCHRRVLARNAACEHPRGPGQCAHVVPCNRPVGATALPPALRRRRG